MTIVHPPASDADRHRAQQIAALFEAIEPDLEQLDQLYADDAHFTDPFNDVRGLAAIRAVYRHMFETLEQPHFVVDAIMVAPHECFLTWDFRFGLSGRERCIHGASQLQFDTRGRITRHLDHWDSAELYRMLPLVGTLMRWLRRRMAAQGRSDDRSSRARQARRNRSG